MIEAANLGAALTRAAEGSSLSIEEERRLRIFDVAGT
jgi:hypothetical protein